MNDPKFAFNMTVQRAADYRRRSLRDDALMGAGPTMDPRLARLVEFLLDEI